MERGNFDNANERCPESVDLLESGSSVVIPESTPNCSLSRSEGGDSECGEVGNPDNATRSRNNGILLYRDDVVKSKWREDFLGMVTEVAGESDSEGSITDDSDGEDDEEKPVDVGNNGNAHENGDVGDENGIDNDDSLLDNQVRVVWTDGSETIQNMGDIEVVDRGFLHGDIVTSHSDPTGQLGLVVDVSIAVDLQASNGEVIRGISSRNLKKIREFSIGDYVIHGPWLGRVDGVLDNVTVLFDDGSVCKVTKADPLRLKAVSKSVIDDENCPYYPGQHVRAVSASVFRNSRWLSGLWKASRLEGTVIKVQAASVVVYWIASAFVGIGTDSTTVPAEEQNPKNLTILSCFSYANWQLGDWCLLAPSPFFASSEEGSQQTSQGASDSAIGELETSEVMNHMMTRQDGLEACNQGSSSLDPCIQGDAHVKSTIICSNMVDSEDRIGDSMKPNVTDESDENTTIESDNVVPDCDPCGTSLVSKEMPHESWPSYRKKLRKVFFKRDKKTHKKEDTFERALRIVNVMTKVDVAWQDGTKEFGLNSKSLIPIDSPDGHDFFPEQYVVEKGSDDGDESSEIKRVGVVRTVNAKDRTACIRWCQPVSRPEDLREFGPEEEMSVYELDIHQDYEYCYGDVVVRLTPASVHADTTASNPSEFEGTTGRAEELGDNEEVQHDASIGNFTCLSWVGNITGIQDGDIEVTWADGVVSKVGPQAVYVVNREEDGGSFDAGSEASDGGASWETVDDNEADVFETTEKDAEQRSPGAVDGEEKMSTSPEDDNSANSGPLSMPLAALGFVTRLATGLFTRNRRKSDVSDSDHDVKEDAQCSESNEGDVEYDSSESHDASKTIDISEHHEDPRTNNRDMQMEDKNDSLMSFEPSSNVTGSPAQNEYNGFKHFDITETPSDHHFIGGVAQSGSGRKWAKKIQQEWSILEKNLPDAIYVRVFEDRMDLLRAVIVGASGTPYHDGLFFFDLQLPQDYPQVPPLAYYHSWGLRINPNLYVEGKVCLSLLNTWTGKGNEVWDPSTSSILQVLVSLQGLVLNSKPYFNEAGFEKQVGTIEGEKNSLPYNENTYLLNLKSMLYLLRRPPLHFQDFAKDHFRKRGSFILKACAAYMDGCAIGTLTKDAHATEKSRESPCSVGLKLMLAKIIPRLISALLELGVDCDEFVHLMK